MSQIRFMSEPYSLDSSLGRASFRFGDQSMEDRHGPIVQTPFRWPASAEDGRITLTVEDLGGKRTSLEQNSGAWSLFRLLEQMEVAHHNRSEEHTSELQSRENLVGRLLLEKNTPA